jgi:hypothetical protein
MPAFKLKQAAKAAGVPPQPIGTPALSKDETIAKILELEGARYLRGAMAAEELVEVEQCPSLKYVCMALLEIGARTAVSPLLTCEKRSFAKAGSGQR